MILFINTAEQNKIFVALVKENKLKSKLELKGEFHQSKKLLPLIERLLKKNKIKLGDLSGIIVVSGPGGFTSVRIGVVTANTLGFALGIPVAGIRKVEGATVKELIREGLKRLKKVKVGEIVLPFYGKEPNITKPKKRN
jgi:tRNA threonylcarbamoyladenosine biosynthesis protein TsaB